LTEGRGRWWRRECAQLQFVVDLAGGCRWTAAAPGQDDSHGKTGTRIDLTE
jgi:hypothetical protein